ncbi:hypothetical protein HZF24_07015 [Sedimentibacter hydroxybenzoicus DSM 7310]|uniref:Uncharacterized protein n=1 Tax=Sedimentibacter hydroxybenzoicus DSM 7310 TaxID=1123245 RepID=A0A974BIK3_SEDHY|nr:hypothetical protein [Sedimentibacter hydroxybenzoicus]NYB73889.1 hypothetical protein [Sedimentibacter hydroxybenzoicus DSM 7310]
MARIFEPAQDRAITRKFSKEKFLKNAQRGIKQNLGNHTDTLDGMQVNFADDSFYGIVESY